MTLLRKIYTDNSTIGKLSIDDYECWCLEPTARRQDGKPVCIPKGRYKVEMRESAKHKMMVPGLLEVPGRTDIEIHIGNKAGSFEATDTLGCILPGKDHMVDWVSDSRIAFNELIPLMVKALKEGELFINVV